LPIKKENIFIHIGLERTGTTNLQHNYFPRLEGIRYFNKFKPLRDYVISAQYHLKSEIDYHLKADNAQPILISNEGLFDGNAESIWRLKEILPNATIIVTLRNQYDRIFSLYSRGSGSGTLACLLPYTRFIKTFKRSIINHNSYASIVSLLRNLFEDRVRVFLFEEYKNDFNELSNAITGLMMSPAWKRKEDFSQFKNITLNIYHLNLTKPYFFILRKLGLNKSLYPLSLWINSLLKGYADGSARKAIEMTRTAFGEYFNHENGKLAQLLDRELPPQYYNNIIN